MGGFENIRDPVQRVVAESEFSSAMAQWEDDYDEDTKVRRRGPVPKAYREAKEAFDFMGEDEDDFNYGG